MSIKMEDIPYQVGATDKVQTLEEELKRELTELKNELEENEMVHGITRAISSVPLPKDVQHFQKEREIVINRALQVSEAKPLAIQAHRMREELEICQESDYTSESMPLLLHQHFVDRMHQLVQCKHMHMLRWKRFCQHTATIEALYPHYQERLSHIMAEYNDCSERAQRLAVAREAYLSNGNFGIMAVKMDDLLIYLRWLVTHLHSIKKFNQFLRVIQWLPITHKEDLAPKKQESTDEEEDMMGGSRIPSRYNDNASSRPRSTGSHPQSARSDHSAMCTIYAVIPPTPPPVNPMVLSTTPVSGAQYAYAAAAAGGGLASDENNLNLPLHLNDFNSLKPHLNFLAHLYGMTVDVENINSPADEMELYANVSRKFRQIFARQEQLRTFKTYGKSEVGQENWGSDHSTHALKQESNWVPFVKLKPERDLHMEKKMVELRQLGNIDELLRMQSRFMQVANTEKVQESLRSHATAVKDPILPNPVSVTSNRTAYHTRDIWKRIYKNPDLYSNREDPLDVALQEFDEKDAENVSFGKKSRAASARKRSDSYDFTDARQMLGLDEGESDGNDPNSVQGAHLSFLQLRHLRIRDLQRTSLSILNYFRSIERTLTINDGGLSLESGHLKKTSAQNHRKHVGDGQVGGANGLGSHHYVHYTPRDYKIEETDSMEFSEVDNHDDFYSIDEGRIHVQDQRGYYIVYDTALQDLKSLEHDLLLIATHFIERNRDLRSASRIERSESARRRQQFQSTGGCDLGSYGHQELDRFGILLDIWTSETAFLDCKRQLLDCYMEAYQHVFDREEKHNLAQVMTNIMARRPRFDFSGQYLVRGYRMECICLRLEAQLVKSMLDKQIQDQRDYTQKVCQSNGKDFGLPYGVIQKYPISINLSRSALKNIYMLEFHPSLAIASRIPDALKHAYWEIHQMHRPDTMMEQVMLEKHMLEMVVKEWNTLEEMGSSYTQQAQKDLFTEAYIEDPGFVVEIAHSLAHQQEQKATKNTMKDKQIATINTVGSVAQAVTLRSKLLDAAWECEILSDVYRKQAIMMGYDECHLFLRFVQFEFASFKDDAGKPPPVFITALQEEDSESTVDRYVPNHLYLAIHELDESNVGRFSFRNRESIVQLLKGGSTESLQTILMCQVVHKNALISAVQQASACQPVRQIDLSSARPSSPMDTKSEKSSATMMTGMSVTTQGTALHSSKHSGSSHSKGNKGMPEAFVSLQLEKGPSRDLMLNEFVNKKQQMTTVLKNPVEMEKLKRKLLNEYCHAFNVRLSQYSMRGQIISYYNSIMGLLEKFPEVRETYFMIGEPNEKKDASDSEVGLEADPRTLKRRPRRVLSEGGKSVLNLWFIPHETESLVMYKKMDDDQCHKALLYHLRLVAALHDILQFLCAHSRLGSSQARLGTNKSEVLTADWGGTEGIGADLREIQKQIDHMEKKTDPEMVCKMLAARRDIMFLEFDVAIRHSIRDTFMGTGNQQAYRAVTDCMHFALHNLSNAQKESLFSLYLPVPEPLEATDPKARLLYPHRNFLNRHGPFPIHFPQWHMIEYNMQLCLAGIKAVDRNVANGEILGVSLLMEDVLMSGQQDRAIYTADSDDDDEETPCDDVSSKAGSSRPNSAGTVTGQPSKKSKHLSRINQPIESYKLLRSFLILWKQLETYKYNWGRSKLSVETINTPSLYKQFCLEYKKEILYPILVSVARRYGQAELYEGMVSENEVLVMPKGVSEMEIRTRQLVKLLEGLECQMINEVRKKLSRELNLVLAERAREESTLPTDLWKRPVMKESFTMNKPHIAEDFIQAVMEKSEEENNEIRFSREHFNLCLNKLASDVMARERHNYDNYSMYYENLLRIHHQLLYQKEQEIKLVRDQLKAAQADTMVEVQCQLADASQDLLLEITALRAKIAEMRQISLTQERDVRERVQEDYNSLVQNLFSGSFDLKKKFDEFREVLHDDVHEKINETRREAIQSFSRLRQRSGIDKDEEDSRRDQEHSQKMRDIQHENHCLNLLQMKMKAMHSWKSSHEYGKHTKQASHLRKAANHSKKECLEIQMMAEEEVVLLRQQLIALRQALRDSQQECQLVQKELDKEKLASVVRVSRIEPTEELKIKQEKNHASQQRARSQKQLEQARRENIDKLLDELDDKEVKLKSISDEQDKHRRLQQLTSDRAKRGVADARKKLQHERSLKLGAFSRVDQLQTQIYDIENGLYGQRPQTALGIGSRSRASSATKSPATRTGASHTSGGIWPPSVTWPANRSVTPGLELSSDYKTVQRPKSDVLASPRIPRIRKARQIVDVLASPRIPRVQKARQIVSVGHLRSRIAEQLLNELDAPDHHETIMKLEEMQLMKQKVC